jgi:LacI family transcriptional regulator
MKTAPRIAVLLDSSRGYERGLLQGVWQYARLHGPWVLLRRRPYYQRISGLANDSPAELRRARVDGVIAHYRPELRKILDLGVPVVFAPGMELTTDTVSVVNDNGLIGTMAADHLAGLGLRNLAYAGFELQTWSTGRLEGFVSRAAALGLSVEPYLVPFRASRRPAASDEKRLLAWLRGLSKPVGLMACNDEFALLISELCYTHALRVPEQVALLGVDNDVLICEQSSPPLSSIEIATQRAGYEAAEFLDNLLRGKPGPQAIVAQPIRVVGRQSTDCTAIEDQEVAAALHFIRENSSHILRVKDVAKACSISRRTLGTRFLHALGHTVGEEIHLRRVEHIKLLLTATNHSIVKIAKGLGFFTDQNFARYFHRQVGVTPLEYRKRFGPI